MNGIKGKHAVITGGSRGIGRAIALRLAHEGARVALSYSRSQEQADEVVRLINDTETQAICVRADTAQVADTKHLIEEAVAAFGPLDILVSNAGIEHFGALEDVTQADFDRVFAVNTRGQFFAMQQGAAHMNDGGRIVCTSSISARRGIARHAVYAASKAAVEALAMNLAAELGPRRITVNAIVPGGVTTDMAAEHGPAYRGDYSQVPLSKDELAERLKLAAPLGRAAMPEDIANTVAFLVSEEGGWINGQAIVATGGA